MKSNSAAEAVLIVDEIQKIGNWSETVKSEWDKDTRENRKIKVVLLGSARLGIQQGLSESLAGRFEVIRMTHWSFKEMETAFGITAEQYVWFGGYPGAHFFIQDETRWKNYVKDAIVEPTLSRDILLLTRVEKPALLRRLFELGSTYSGQILSYTKILGQLQDRGNMATIAHYHELLDAAGLLGGLENYHRQAFRSRASLPKWQVYDSGLMSAQSSTPFAEISRQPRQWGHWIETAVGAHLLNAAARQECRLWYWRERDQEVDFVVERHGKLIGIEVKSNADPITKGMETFEKMYLPLKMILVGDRGLPWQAFLKLPVTDLF